MSEPARCEHEYAWRLSPADEAGWICQRCAAPAPGEPPGYSPALDVALIEDKVRAILMEMDDHGIVAISNGTQGETLTGSVAEKCVAYGYYDQGTIVRYVMAMVNDGGYWKRQGDAVRAGAVADSPGTAPTAPRDARPA
jgi:hypothetical protein